MSATPPSSGSLKKSKRRILVVDDEPMIVDLVCELLEAAGYETCSAGDTREALEAMDGKPMDAVLLDVWLPDEDGLTFLQRLKALHPALPVIMITGAGYDEDLMKKALHQGAAAYVSKGTNLENVVVAVRQLLK